MADPQQSSNHGKSTTIALIVLVIVLVVLGLYWFWLREPEPATSGTPVDLPAPQVIPQPQTPEPEPEPEPKPEPAEAPEPEPAPADSEPLPQLGQSDPAVLEAAESLSPDGQLVKLLVPEGVLLKFVRAIIAMEEGNVVKDYRPVTSPQPPFKVLPLDEPTDPEVGQRYRIDPANYDRYTAYVDTLASLDKETLATLYHRYYPLLDEAYKQYGVDRGGFLNITLSAIDKTLAAPAIERELILVQPKVFYEFQDPAIEDLPALNKLLIRMGPENARKMKASLRELREALAETP